ncbi:uncharacterized protein LOC107044626 [Diachasma alloeum]|uniref:uncharacterized protein LOC107044626 n=1 Tax=Diachasma alloeum TaxID=454923 RepID=UPI0007382F6B|nr:uncharacterized protein LOC107044626 [Diachasma alloeum]
MVHPSFINISYSGDSGDANQTVSWYEEYVKARDIANSIPIFSYTNEHFSLDEFDQSTSVGADNGYYRYITEYPSIPIYSGGSLPPELYGEQIPPQSRYHYQQNRSYSQPYNQSNTPTPSSSYGHRNYSEQRRNQDPSRDLVTALLNEYLLPSRNRYGNGYRQTPPRPPGPPPSIPGHTAHPGEPPSHSFNSVIAYGQTPNEEDESDYEDPTENAENPTTDQILALANILAVHQRPHAVPSKPKQNPSDMDEIKSMLQQLALSLNNPQTQNRPSSGSRPPSRPPSREREERNTLRNPTRTQQNRASPSTDGTIPKETLNEIVARQLSAMMSGQNQHSLHTMSSMHPRQ